MESFSAPFSVTTATTMPTTTTVSSSSNQSFVQAQQNMGHLQNVHFPDNSAPLGFPNPYFVPCDQNLLFPQMNTFPQMNDPLAYPLYSLPTVESGVLNRMSNSELQGWSQESSVLNRMSNSELQGWSQESSVLNRMPNSELQGWSQESSVLNRMPNSELQGWSQESSVLNRIPNSELQGWSPESNVLNRMPNSELQGWSQPGEEERNMSRVARDRRKQARQRNRTSSALGAPTAPMGTIRGQQPVPSGWSNLKVTVNENKTPNVFCTPDGKRLEEILTKELKKSDVGSLGRIVLPKREAEMKLPALSDKEGIDIVFKDVYSELSWSLRYKYWSNNKSRMYVLENAGDFVSYYELQIGDSITLYEDESKNLYVSTKKEGNPEVSEPLASTERLQYMHTPYAHQAKDEEEEAALALLIKELNHKREADTTNSLLTFCNAEGSTSGTRYDKTAQDLLPHNTTMETSSQTAIEGATSCSENNTKLANDDMFNNFDDVYANLDNILDGSLDNIFDDDVYDYRPFDH